MKTSKVLAYLFLVFFASYSQKTQAQHNSFLGYPGIDSIGIYVGGVSGVTVNDTLSAKGFMTIRAGMIVDYLPDNLPHLAIKGFAFGDIKQDGFSSNAVAYGILGERTDNQSGFRLKFGYYATPMTQKNPLPPSGAAQFLPPSLATRPGPALGVSSEYQWKTGKVQAGVWNRNDVIELQSGLTLGNLWFGGLWREDDTWAFDAQYDLPNKLQYTIHYQNQSEKEVLATFMSGTFPNNLLWYGTTNLEHNKIEESPWIIHKVETGLLLLISSENSVINGLLGPGIGLLRNQDGSVGNYFSWYLQINL